MSFRVPRIPHLPFIPTKVGTQAEVAAGVLNETTGSAWVPTFVGMRGVFGWGGFP
jgi:hypothetical protein